MAACDFEASFVKTWFANFDLIHARAVQFGPFTDKDAKKFSKQSLKDVLQPALPAFPERKAQLAQVFSQILNGGVIDKDAFKDTSKDFMWLFEFVLAQAEPRLYALYYCVAESFNLGKPLPSDWFDPTFAAMSMPDVFGPKPLATNPALTMLDKVLHANVDKGRTFYPNSAALGAATVEASVKAILS